MLPKPFDRENQADQDDGRADQLRAAQAKMPRYNRSMYEVIRDRDDKRVIIKNWAGKVIYSASEEAFILTKDANGVSTMKIKNLGDDQLLRALASALKLPFDEEVPL